MNRLAAALARRIVERSGTDSRVEELRAHLDQREADGHPLSLLDVGSLALLAIRSPRYRDAARSFLASYGVMMLAAISGWWVASWSGLIGSTEAFVAEVFALEEFRFAGIAILGLFAVVAALVATFLVFATRTTVPRAYGMTVLFGLALGVWAVASGAIAQTEAVISDVFAIEAEIDPLIVALWYSALSLPIIGGIVVLARQSFVRAYSMVLLFGAAIALAVTASRSVGGIEAVIGELAGVKDLQINVVRALAAYAAVMLPVTAAFTTLTKLAGRPLRSTTRAVDETPSA